MTIDEFIELSFKAGKALCVGFVIEIEIRY